MKMRAEKFGSFHINIGLQAHRLTRLFFLILMIKLLICNKLENF